MKTKAPDNNKVIIDTCMDLINTFNPVTHSIDTHCLERLGDVSKPDAKPENLLIQQIVYGWQKEKAVLKCFINDFYADNGSRVLRTDITLYTIFAYIAVFRLEEMGFAKFKQLALTQEPLKITTFIVYLYDKSNLWNTLRSSWMKVRDLTFVEDVLIVNVEKFASVMLNFTFELEANAVSNAEEAKAQEEMKARGEAGLKKVAAKKATRPVSPKLTKTRPPIVPEPQRIEQNVAAHEVPGFLDNNTLSKLAGESEARRENERQLVKEKYDPKLLFEFQPTKGGRPIEEVRKEVEEQRSKGLAFDSTYFNAPPNFSKAPNVRMNASVILREDAIYRKQQAKDAAILKNYEEELRDPTEYYIWQNEWKLKDAADKLEHVAMRREQAKQSAVDSKEAILRQRESNKMTADRLRVEAEEIRRQKELDAELAVLQNQVAAKAIIEVRDSRPQEAVKKVLEERVDVGKRVREELEAARRAKEEMDAKEEAVKADRIMQLRAENEVHKKHIVVFDPTQTAGIGLLDEMSYMEMKERLKNERLREVEVEKQRREDIHSDKARKQSELDRRMQTVLAAREVRAEVNRSTRVKEKEARAKAAEEAERARQVAAVAMAKELKEKKEKYAAEQAALRAEEEEIRRKQQYLGAAAGQMEETRERQLAMARERQERAQQEEAEVTAKLAGETQVRERLNKSVLLKTEKKARVEQVVAREKDALFEKRAAIDKLKGDILYKKGMFKEGQAQHVVTKRVLTETNPYAASMSEEIHTKVLASRQLNTNRAR